MSKNFVGDMEEKMAETAGSFASKNLKLLFFKIKAKINL
jgi:hypothetical protein